MADDAGSPRRIVVVPGRDATVPAPVRLCESWELDEKGRALVFDVLRFGEPMHAFALRFEGSVVAYLNRCVHVPTEMDWQPGEFLDADRAFIVCSIHGATYDPRGGQCVGGPCNRGRLTPLAVHETDGEVWWQPSADTRPGPAAMPSTGAA